MDLPILLLDFLWSDFYIGPAFEDFWDAVATAQSANFLDFDVND